MTRCISKHSNYSGFYFTSFSSLIDSRDELSIVSLIVSLPLQKLILSQKIKFPNITNPITNRIVMIQQRSF